MTIIPYVLYADTFNEKDNCDEFNYVKKSINPGVDYSELSYENDSDRRDIAKLLLLFNVESVRQHGEQSQWFPHHLLGW